MLMIEQPELVWGLIASMFVGNVILLVINLPLAPVFASILRIPTPISRPAFSLSRWSAPTPPRSTFTMVAICLLSASSASS